MAERRFSSKCERTFIIALAELGSNQGETRNYLMGGLEQELGAQ